MLIKTIASLFVSDLKSSESEKRKREEPGVDSVGLDRAGRKKSQSLASMPDDVVGLVLPQLSGKQQARLASVLPQAQRLVRQDKELKLDVHAEKTKNAFARLPASYRFAEVRMTLLAHALVIKKMGALSLGPSHKFSDQDFLDLVEFLKESFPEVRALSFTGLSKLRMPVVQGHPDIASLSFRACRNFKGPILIDLPALAEIAIDDCVSFQSFLRTAEADPFAFAKVSISRCPSLVGFAITTEYAPQLKHFAISHCKNIIGFTIANHPVLETVSIVGCKTATCLDLTGSAQLREVVIEACPRLSNLRIPVEAHTTRLGS